MLESIAHWIINVISTLGYPGILLTMAIESCLVPLPSEIIMPFSGYLASVGRFNFAIVCIVGALGNTIGSLTAYYLGFWGHERVVRRFVKKWGKYILISEDEIDGMEKFMKSYKGAAVLIARVIPGLRTVISLGAGIAKIPLWWFIFLTFIGSLVWSTLLAFIGFTLGQNWQSIGDYFHKFDALIVILIVLGIVLYIWKKLKSK